MAAVISLADTHGRHGLRDAPAQLRRLADRLEREAAAYGEGFVARIVVVGRVSGQEPWVAAYGDVEHLAQAYMDLHAGADQLMAMGRPERV